MLSYIAHTISPSAIWLCQNVKPVISPYTDETGSSIIEYFGCLRDKENTLHLLQDDSNDFDYCCANYEIIVDLLEFPFAPRQYKAIGDVIIESIDSDEDVKILYKCYQVTGNIEYRDTLVSYGVCHIINNPLIPVTLERVTNLEDISGPELLYLFRLLSPDDQELYIQELELRNLIIDCNIYMLEHILHRVTHKEHYCIAYALCNKKSLPFTDDALQPAEYFIARKYTDWNGKLLTTDTTGLHAVVDYLADESDAPLVTYMNQFLKRKILLYKKRTMK